MNQTDPTIERLTTPYTLTQQLRLLIHDRDLEMDTLQVIGEMMSRRYLETMSDNALTRMMNKTVGSINDIMIILIIDRASDNGHDSMSTRESPDPSGRLLRDARRYIELTGIGYEIEISRRIADDAMDILSQRRKKVENE